MDAATYSASRVHVAIVSGVIKSLASAAFTDTISIDNEISPCYRSVTKVTDLFDHVQGNIVVCFYVYNVIAVVVITWITRDFLQNLLRIDAVFGEVRLDHVKVVGSKSVDHKPLQTLNWKSASKVLVVLEHFDHSFVVADVGWENVCAISYILKHEIF